jgi:shikimate kinase
MRLARTLIPLALVSAAVAAPPAGAATDASAAALREYEGTVVSVNRDARTFRLRDTERGTVRIRVTRNTRYERIAGLSGLRAGMTNIEAVVRRSNGRWIALEVERSGGGGEHGGGDDDDRGSDDD